MRTTHIPRYLTIAAFAGLLLAGCGGSSKTTISTTAITKPTSAVGHVAPHFEVYDSAAGSCLHVSLQGGASTTSCAKHSTVPTTVQAWIFRQAKGAGVIYGITNSKVALVTLIGSNFKQFSQVHTASGYNGPLSSSRFFVIPTPANLQGQIKWSAADQGGGALGQGN
jgi:hypothetical protein